jgi:3-phenylpropionate/trans-cinnamate dioxygenase ferredoxin subunit
MSWTKTVADDDVELGKVVVFEAGDARIAICRTEDGYYAIDDVCSHDGGALDQGELFGDRIECPRHGAQFDVKTGRALTLPAVRPIASYPVRVVDGAVEIDIS